MSHINQYLEEHQTVMQGLCELMPLVDQVVIRILQSLDQGGKILFVGNGGSASDAQHLAAELVGRFKAERRALAGIALTTDTSILTAISNDYGYDYVFSRQIEALCQPHDVVMALSTSGNSPSILKAVEAAKQIGAYVIGMTGQTGGQLKNMADACLCVPSKTVARIQEAHIFIGHSICEEIERFLLDVKTQSELVEMNA